MKKAILATAAVILLIGLSGCAETAAPHDDTEKRSQPESSVSRLESPVPESSTSSLWEGEESRTAELPESEEPEQPKESAQPQMESHEQTTQGSKPTEKEPSQQAAGSQKPVTAQPEKPVVSQPEKTPEPAKPDKPPVSESSVTEVSPAEPEAPAFDVSAYVQTAKNYGTQIGLALDSTATACWDNPITANAGCRYLERDIRDALDWYKQSGYTAFWVWTEQVGNGEYLIYIGYA